MYVLLVCSRELVGTMNGFMGWLEIKAGMVVLGSDEC